MQVYTNCHCETTGIIIDQLQVCLNSTLNLTQVPTLSVTGILVIALNYSVGSESDIQTFDFESHLYL